MKTKTILMALGLAALLAGCDTPTSNAPAAGATLSSIEVSPSSVTLDIDETRSITVTAVYSDGSEAEITDATWSSDSTNATVAAGVITAVAATGDTPAVITATKSGKTATVSVTVNAAPEPTISSLASFDEETSPVLSAFGSAGAEIVADPADASNKVLKVVKTASSETWAGVTISTAYSASVPRLMVTDTDTEVTLRVYAPAAGLKIRLKAEDASDGSKNHEVDMFTTVANDWETLTFDFSVPVSGGSAFNTTDTYNKVSVFADFGVKPASDETFYFDDLKFVGELGAILQAPDSGNETPATDAGTPGVASASALVVISSHSTESAYVAASAIEYQNWWQGGTPASFTTGSTSVLKITGMSPAGSTGLAFTPHLNATSKPNFHAEVWVDSGTKVQFKIVTASAGEQVIDVDVSGSSQQWKSVDIDLSGTSITSGIGDIGQIGVINASGCPNIYLDNIYFH